MIYTIFEMERFKVVNNTRYELKESLQPGIFEDSDVFMNSDNNEDKILINTAAGKISSFINKINKTDPEKVADLFNELQLNHDNLSNILENQVIPEEENEIRLTSISKLVTNKLQDVVEMTSSCTLNESHALYIFKQIIDAIIFLSDRAIYLYSLRLDDILLDESMKVVISNQSINNLVIKLFQNDFQWTNEILCKSICLAPEIYKKEIYSFQKSVVFNLGVILFTVLTGKQPFHYQRMFDKRYKSLGLKEGCLLWETVEDDLSNEVKELVISMMALEPSDRFDLDDIQNHSWYKSTCVQQSEFLEFYTNLKDTLFNKLNTCNNYQGKQRFLKFNSNQLTRYRSSSIVEDQSEHIANYFADHENLSVPVLKQLPSFGLNKIIIINSKESNDIFDVLHGVLSIIKDQIDVKFMEKIEEDQISIQIALNEGEIKEDDKTENVEVDFTLRMSYLGESSEKIVIAFDSSSLYWKHLIEIVEKIRKAVIEDISASLLIKKDNIFEMLESI